MGKGNIFGMICLSLFFLCLNNGITAVIMMWGLWFVYYFRSAKGEEIKQNRTAYYLARTKENLMINGFNPYYVQGIYDDNETDKIEEYYKKWEEKGVIDTIREVGWDARTPRNAFTLGMYRYKGKNVSL